MHFFCVEIIRLLIFFINLAQQTFRLYLCPKVEDSDIVSITVHKIDFDK